MTTSINSSVYQNIQEAYANSAKLRFAFLLREQQDSSGDSEYHKDAFGVDYVMNEPNRKKIPHDDLNLFKNEGYHNILSVLKKATREEIDYWSNWYQHANGHVQEIATQYDVPIEVAAAVCAVLSPNLGWKMNLMAARRVMDNWMYKGGADGYKWHDSIPAYKTNVNKAYYILKTGDVAAVNGPKVTVFFQSLLDPDKLERDLVLDGHAINVWRGLKTPLKNLKSPTKNEREAIIYDYRKVADIVGLTPQQVQAVTWFIWKSVKEPPVVKGKFNVEQPEREELNEFFGSAIAASTATNMNRGRTSSFGRTSSGGDSVTQTDVDGVLRGIKNRGSQTTAQLAGAVRNKLRVDPKNIKVISSITDMVEKTMKRGKYGTYGESKANLSEMSDDDYKDTVASAEMAHHGQKRRSGEDYITHPKEVSAIVDRLYPGDDLASLVALLHDTLEDAPSLGTVHDTEEMKSFIRGSIGDELAAEEVIDAVERLTHEPGGDYSSYVQGLLNNKLALRVKLADMLHNLSSTPSPKQALKYKSALEALRAAAGDIKPKGISPLHWKLLMNQTSKLTSESSVKVNMVLVKEHIRKLVREQLEQPQVVDLDKELKQEVLRVLDLWLKTELSHTLGELAFAAQENSNGYPVNFQDVIDNLRSFDLLNLPETDEFFRKNIRIPEALEVYEEQSFDKNFYADIDQIIQRALSTADFARPTKRRY